MPIIKVSEYTQESPIATPCIICGESVELNMIEEIGIRNGHYVFKVCDKCKRAVMKMREMK